MSPVPEHRRYRVAILAGDGVGPELVAEASRALTAVGRLHGFRVDEAHLPFGGVALRRFGDPLPTATIGACRGSDAVLVASTKEPALEGVKASLPLAWRVQRILATPGDLALVSPLVEEAGAGTAERAFELARTRRARVASVGLSKRWETLVQAQSERHPGIVVELLAPDEALAALAHVPDRLDVVLAEARFVDTLADAAASAGAGPRVVASGRLPERGPGIFGPTHGSAPDIAGQGVANPSGILLAAALMLGEGLGERSAARTLEGAVVETLSAGALTPDMLDTGAGATTRQFMDVLLAELPGARRDHEFALEVR